MKKLYNSFLLSFALLIAGPIGIVSCATTGCTTQQEIKTLGSIGLTAKSVIDRAADLYVAGQITEAKWNEIANFYDLKFQPAYRTAIIAVKLDDSKFAPANVIELVTELQKLYSSLKTTSNK